MKTVARFLATGCFSGLVPVAPGTFGSAAALAVWTILSAQGVITSILDQVVAALIVSIIGFAATHRYLQDLGKNTAQAQDPQSIVIDEWAGIFITLIGISRPSFLMLLIGFILFRFFDITKPWIVSRAEKLPGAFGIMMDDILAGVAAGLVLQLVQLL